MNGRDLELDTDDDDGEFFASPDAGLVAELQLRCDRLRAALVDMLRGGQHEGPCTNEENPWDDACELHLAVARERSEFARALLREDFN